jgi:hypothetical protein
LSSGTYGFADQDEVKAFDDASVLRGWLDWRDRNNLYRSDCYFITSSAVSANLQTRRSTLANSQTEWNNFWNLKSTSSLQGEIRFRGGDLSAQPAAAIEQLPADSFRLDPQSPGASVGPNGADLGADLGLVGPGAAYQRWQATPVYQQWLEEAPK